MTQWKMCFALFMAFLGLVAIYAGMPATSDAEKVSAVLKNQAAQLELIKSEVRLKLDRALLNARSVIATFDFIHKKLSAEGERIFAAEKTFLALELWREQKAQAVFRVEKPGAAWPPEDLSAALQPIGPLKLEPMEGGGLMTVRYALGDQGIFRLRAIVDFKELLPPIAGVQLALAQGELVPFNKNAFLLSESRLGIANLRLIAATPKAEILATPWLARSFFVALFAARRLGATSGSL